MRDHNIYCDHCGKTLNTMIDFDDITIEIDCKWTTVDLCTECLDKLYDIVCNFCTRKGGAE